MKELLEAGVHIGHRIQRWNPKMLKYLYGKKQGIHIIDIVKTVRALQQACVFLQSASTLNKKILFVGTKSTAKDLVSLAADECNGFFIKHRWLGGFLTNWTTMEKCIQKLHRLDSIITPSSDFSLESSTVNNEDTSFIGTDRENKDEVTPRSTIAPSKPGSSSLTKKELLALKKQQHRLTKFFGGVKNMNSRPDILIILGQNEEKNAVKESNKLQIPNITIVDTDCDPELADYPIPANDDSFYSLQIVLQKLVQAYNASMFN